jgi:hypothetical protein
VIGAFSNEVDENFVEAFREKAAPNTKLLVLHDSTPSDRLLSGMVDLQIRSAERFYIVEAKFSGATRSNGSSSYVRFLNA